MTESLRPIRMQWDGEVFRPASKFWAGVADRNLVVGEQYFLVEENERDARSHRHYFSAIAECWKNLPDDLALEFQNPEELRARALIMTGYRHERRMVCESRAEAMRAYQFLRPISRSAYYALCGEILIEWTPESQSYRSMKKKRFMKSKWDVLNWCADQIGVDVDTLYKEAGQAA